MTDKKRIHDFFTLVFHFMSVVVFCVNLQAQISSLDSLRSTISEKEDSLDHFDEIYSDVKKSFDRLNSEIFTQKRKLETSSNPVLWLILNSNLKKSASLANKMENIQNKKKSISFDLQNDYRKIISVTDSLIKQQMQEVYNQPTGQSQMETLNLISHLETEKKIWQQKLSESTPEESKQLLLEIESDDTIERIQLKIQLLQDRIQQIINELNKLRKQHDEFQSDMQIYTEMLSFMDNMLQNIDTEQEYFDQERNDQIKDEIHIIKLKIFGIDDRMQQLENEQTILEEKLSRFEDRYEEKIKK